MSDNLRPTRIAKNTEQKSLEGDTEPIGYVYAHVCVYVCIYTVYVPVDREREVNSEEPADKSGSWRPQKR